jgi:hypothetical protein
MLALHEPEITALMPRVLALPSRHLLRVQMLRPTAPTTANTRSNAKGINPTRLDPGLVREICFSMTITGHNLTRRGYNCASLSIC